MSSFINKLIHQLKQSVQTAAKYCQVRWTDKEMLPQTDTFYRETNKFMIHVLMPNLQEGSNNLEFVVATFQKVCLLSPCTSSLKTRDLLRESGDVAVCGCSLGLFKYMMCCISNV